jgi:hypothetical protein
MAAYSFELSMPMQAREIGNLDNAVMSLGEPKLYRSLNVAIQR